MGDSLNIGENICRLRRGRKLTQEQLAHFIGVTKGSVSKWETGQSMPDITLLPRLAAYFDITVDELIDYQPLLSREQITKLYRDFALEFVSGSFQNVMDKIQDYVKRYYSCYPFLFQVCVLWLNHYMLAEDGEEQREILRSIVKLCEHIKENCRDVGICNDTIVLQGIAYLTLGQAQEVVDALEGVSKQNKLVNQGGLVISQAYMMLGEKEKAESYTQAAMYSAVLNLIGNATQYLSIRSDDLTICDETISRIEQVAEAYEYRKLHPNNMAVFEYQAALCYALHEEKQKAIKHMGRYVACLEELFSADILVLHGDAYFDGIEEWLKEPLGSMVAPRSRKLVIEDCIQTLSQSVFTILDGEPEYERLKSRVKAIK